MISKFDPQQSISIDGQGHPELQRPGIRDAIHLKDSTPVGLEKFAPFLSTTFAVGITAMIVVGQLYLVIPLLGPMASDWGVAVESAPAVATVFGIGYALGFLVWGPLSDTLGRRRLIVSGLVLTALLSALMPFASTLATACLLRVVQGFSAASFAPPIYAYLAERLEPRRRVVALTWLTSSFLASGIIAQMVSQGIGSAVGWRAVFGASAVGLAACAGLLFWILEKDEERSASRDPLGAFATMGKLVLRPRLLALYGSTATVLLSFMAVYAALQLSGPHGIAGNPTALLWLRASAVPAMLAVPFLTPRLSRIGPTQRIAGAFLIAACCLVLVGSLQPGTLGLGALLFVFVGCLAVASPGLVATISDEAAGSRGGAVALYTFALFVGASLGPQMAVLFRHQGFSALSYAVAGVLVSGALLALLSSGQPARSSQTVLHARD